MASMACSNRRRGASFPYDAPAPRHFVHDDDQQAGDDECRLCREQNLRLGRKLFVVAVLEGWAVPYLAADGDRVADVVHPTHPNDRCGHNRNREEIHGRRRLHNVNWPASMVAFTLAMN